MAVWQTVEHDPETGLTRTVRWITPLRYHGRIVHWIELQESGPDGAGCRNVWITDIKPNRSNAMALAKAGRLRWKIEYADLRIRSKTKASTRRKPAATR